MGVGGPGRPPGLARGAWPTLAALLASLALGLAGGGCSESKDASTGGDRPVGMSEEIWKIYGGAESGVTGQTENPPRDQK